MCWHSRAHSPLLSPCSSVLEGSSCSQTGSVTSLRTWWNHSKVALLLHPHTATDLLVGGQLLSPPSPPPPPTANVPGQEEEEEPPPPEPFEWDDM